MWHLRIQHELLRHQRQKLASLPRGGRSFVTVTKASLQAQNIRIAELVDQSTGGRNSEARTAIEKICDGVRRPAWDGRSVAKGAEHDAAQRRNYAVRRCGAEPHEVQRRAGGHRGTIGTCGPGSRALQEYVRDNPQSACFGSGTPEFQSLVMTPDGG